MFISDSEMGSTLQNVYGAMDATGCNKKLRAVLLKQNGPGLGLPASSKLPLLGCECQCFLLQQKEIIIIKKKSEKPYVLK